MERGTQRGFESFTTGRIVRKDQSRQPERFPSSPGHRRVPCWLRTQSGAAMEDRADIANDPRKPRMVHCEEIDEEPVEESHGGKPMRKLLQERESATERFRAFKRRLL